MAEIIDLSDDEIVCEAVVPAAPPSSTTPVKSTLASDSSPKPKRTKNKIFKCLNAVCRSESNLIRASKVVRCYYAVLDYPKKTRVCVSCSVAAKMCSDTLMDSFKKGTLLSQPLPTPKQTILLTDSDSDPTDNESSEESQFELDTSDLSFSEEDSVSGTEDDKKDTKTFLTSVISHTLTRLGLDSQVATAVNDINQRLLDAEKGFDDLNKEYKDLERNIDNCRIEFYNTLKPDIQWLSPVDIGPLGILTRVTDETEVIPEASVFCPAGNLPPVGPLCRPELKSPDNVFAMKYSLFARWVPAYVMELEKRESKNTYYKIKYHRVPGATGLPRVMTGRQLAYYDPCSTRIPVGTRIIAKYRDDDPKNNSLSVSYYVGIVAETPTTANTYRYLIFFDDGYAQYVVHRDIRVVIESSTSPWEDVATDSREFIKEYLQTYPERPMVRLQKYNFVKTEWNGRWWKAQVLEVDGALVKMLFPLDNRTEWIYRGSTRLSPLFNKKMSMQAHAGQPNKTIRRRTAAFAKAGPVVEYGTFGQEAVDKNSSENRSSDVSGEMGKKRAVARKSTAAMPAEPSDDIIQKLVEESRGVYKKVAIDTLWTKFKPHQCCSKCVLVNGKERDSIEKYKGISPLFYPIKFGWRRQIVKQQRKTVAKNFVYYVSPCGRRMRSIEDCFRYLRITKSNLEIDCFSFELAVDVTNEWEATRQLFAIPDVAYGKENIPLSCINSIDESPPLPLVYCNHRQPTAGVNLNLDQDFLVCCDCVDDCQDKSKCACWQLTIESTRIINNEMNREVGYKYRRLYEQVQTGIYECNSRCNCKKTCLNRVVQHPLRQKLQLFKTARRGWGVRTLHDIPQGGFLCVYVGKVLSDAIANEEGKIHGGDDYYADLDFIEVVEGFKEGYESDVDDFKEEEEIPFHPKQVKDIITEEKNTDSEQEIDGHRNDRDYKSNKYEEKAKLDAREKSARIQARKSKKKGALDDSDEDSGQSSRVSTDSKENPPEDEEEELADEKQRKPQNFSVTQIAVEPPTKKKSIRDFFGDDEDVYIMDAKHTGNIGRFLNHSCQPNVFVQNVFVDTHDLRFPWMAFFASTNVRAGGELTWDYNYEVDTVPGKVKYCYCGAKKCRGRLL